MRKTIRLAVLFLLLFISACDDSGTDPMPQPSTITFTMDVSAYTPVAGEENWFYVTDTDGNVLGTKQMTTGENIVLEAMTESDSINVVRVSRMSNKNVFIYVYGGLRINTVLKLDNQQQDGMPEYTGNATITIENVPFTKANTTVFAARDVQLHAENDNNTVSAEVMVYGEQSTFLVSTFNAEGKPSYRWTTPLSSGEAATYDFSTFSVYPNIIELPRDHDVHYLIAGFNQPWETIGTTFTSSEWFVGSKNPPVLGYLDGYQGYYTSLTRILSYNKWRSAEVRKRGALPTRFEVPDFNFSVIDSSPTRPRVTITKDFTHMRLAYRYTMEGGGIARLTSYAPKNFSLNLKALPPEIQTAYPQLDFSKLVFTQGLFFHELDGTTYEESLQSFLDNTYPVRQAEFILYNFEF